MTKVRSTPAHISVVDATTARIEDSPAGQGTVPCLPDGYDHTDLRVLEWIAAHRRRRVRGKVSGLAA